MTEKEQGAADNAAPNKTDSKVATGAWWKSAFSLFPKKKQAPSTKEQAGAGGGQSSPPGRPVRDETKGSTANVQGKSDRKGQPAQGDQKKGQAVGKRPPRPRRSPRSKASAGPEGTPKQEKQAKQPNIGRGAKWQQSKF